MSSSVQPPPPAEPRAAPHFPTCTCGHLDVLHDISKTKQRTACSVTSGQKAVPCGCRRFSPQEADATGS